MSVRTEPRTPLQTVHEMDKGGDSGGGGDRSTRAHSAAPSRSSTSSRAKSGEWDNEFCMKIIMAILSAALTIIVCKKFLTT